MDDKEATTLPNLGGDEDADDQTSLSASAAWQNADSGEVVNRFTANPYLVVVAGTTLHRVFPLTEPFYVIGRDSQSSISLVDPGISRSHARVVCEDGDYFIEDVGSANGTFLNGRRISGRYRLTSGDRLRFGPTVIVRFEWPSSSETFPEGESPSSITKLELNAWTPDSWRKKPAQQMPKYEDPVALGKALETLRTLPPLVMSGEIVRLKALIAEAQDGDRFLLQGGDCAETFADCNSAQIANKLKILFQMSLVLTHAARKPVIRVGRLAGQYAKPRSMPTETKDGVTLPSYLGDLVNAPEFTAAARRPDPALLVEGYKRAGMTLNFIRSLAGLGFWDRSREPGYLDLPAFERKDMPQALLDEYARMRNQVREGLHFLRAMGGNEQSGELGRVEFFTSHEGLNLEYEASQTRQVPGRSGWFDLTTHLPWIGERTRQINGAHIEYFRGIENPLGIKIGPKATPAELIEYLRLMNPKDEPGKIVLIVRMGAGMVPQKLPPLIEAVQRSRRRVLWVTDPMHGNGSVTKSGLKTRDFSKILQEVEETLDTHDKCGSILGGVHFELTGDDVTECLGAGLTEADLDTRYLTACDPRLNSKQAMEMTFCIARRILASSVRRPSSLPPPSKLL